MTDIRAVEVGVDVSVADDFYTTSLEINRGRNTAGYAKIKGLMSYPGRLSFNQTIEVEISSLENTSTSFVGNLKRATINREGELTIEAYDIYYELYNKQVKLNTEEPRFASEVAEDLLEEVGFNVYRNTDPDELGNGDAYIAPKEFYPGGDVRENRTYGSAKQGQPLQEVLRDLSSKLVAQLWVDKNNVLRIEPYPKHSVYRLPYVTDLEAGEDTVNKKRTVVKGGGATGDLGQAGFSFYSKIAPSARIDFSRDEPDKTLSEENVQTIEDSNVSTKRGVEKLALGSQFNTVLARNSGSVKTVGNPGVEMFDRLLVPFVSQEITSNAQRNIIQELEDQTYVVRSITHMIDTEEGFTTEVGLGPEPGKALNRMVGGPAGELAELFVKRLREQRDDGEEEALELLEESGRTSAGYDSISEEFRDTTGEQTDTTGPIPSTIPASVAEEDDDDDDDDDDEEDQ